MEIVSGCLPDALLPNSHQDQDAQVVVRSLDEVTFIDDIESLAEAAFVETTKTTRGLVWNRERLTRLLVRVTHLGRI